MNNVISNPAPDTSTFVICSSNRATYDLAVNLFFVLWSKFGTAKLYVDALSISSKRFVNSTISMSFIFIKLIAASLGPCNVVSISVSVVIDTFGANVDNL